MANSNQQGRLGGMTNRAKLDSAVKRLIDGAPTPLVRTAPKDFQPGVKLEGGKVVEVTTGPVAEELGTEEDWAALVEAMGVKLPKGYRLILSEARFDPAAWHRDHQGEDAVTREVWRYRFQVVPAALVQGGDEDLDKLFAAARRAKRARPAHAPFDKVTMVVVLGDVQAGKVDHRGGTEELLERLEHAKSEVLKRAKRLKPQQIVIVDGGDAMENFESSPGADRTNDLQLTQQMRLWRRVFWDWVSNLAFLAPEVDVISVPSNHCRVRRGKQNMSTPGDDYGLEVLSQLADIAAENEAYSHVNFWAPNEHEEVLALQLVGGKVLGVAHGHQMANPNGAVQYMTKQVLGQTPVAGADVMVFNHFHTFWMRSFGRSKWMLGAPTMDSGSSWYRNVSGEESDPGVLTFVMDEAGWRDLEVVWARPGIDFEVIE